MKLQVLAIYDTKAHAFLQPMLFTHVDIAKRAFGNSANDPASQIGKNPSDFVLFRLGEWDDDNAQFTLLEHRVNLGAANEYEKKE